MSKMRIDQVTRTSAAEQVVLQDAQKRIHLFTHSRMEKGRKTFAGIGKQDLSAITSSGNGEGQKRANRQEEEETISVKMRDGTILEMPRLTQEQYADIDTILSQSTPEQAEHLVRTGQIFGAEAYNELEEGRAEGPYSLTATSAAQTSYEAYAVTTAQKKQSELTTGAVLFGMYGVEQNLKNYFQSIQQEQKLAADLRTDAAELEEALADWPDDGSTEVFDYSEVIFNDDGSVSVIEHKGAELTKGEAKALLEKLKGQIVSIGQFDQRQMMQLQRMVEKYQQAMNTLSNIMKNTDETHKAIIANAKA